MAGRFQRRQGQYNACVTDFRRCYFRLRRTTKKTHIYTLHRYTGGNSRYFRNSRRHPTTTTPVMMDHFGYFSRHFFVWDFWDFCLFCLCFMNQAITSWGFQVILGRTTSRSRRISGTVANTFFFFPLPLHSFQKGKGKH